MVAMEASVMIFLGLFAFGAATSDDSKACKALDKLITDWRYGHYASAAATMADGVEVTYGKNMALATPSLTNFGTQNLDQVQAATFLKTFAEAYDFYDVRNFAAYCILNIRHESNVLCVTLCTRSLHVGS